MKPKFYLKPVISEKTVDQTAKNCYTFLVAPNISRTQVSDLIFEQFSQKPLKINMLKKRSKEVRRARRKPGFTSEYKKALVYMKKGVRLPGFEVAESKDKKKETKENDQK